MLYDKRWDVTTKQARASQVLIAAADNYATGKYHWIRGRLKDEFTGVCLIGAIGIVSTSEIGYIAYGKLERYLGKPISMWNDCVCVNQQMAVEALLGAALEIEE